jgi:acetoin utilization protein AcuB
MFVGDRMSHPVITVSPEMPVVEALNMMHREHIRRAPVVKDGKLVGIVSDKDLLNASPSAATTLSVWEINYLVSKILVKEVMAEEVITVSEGTPIEEAARIMLDHKIGGAPVMRGETIVGIITETDMFKIFPELMGARRMGVRVTALIKDEPGQLARLTKAIATQGGNFVAFGMFSGEDSSNYLITCKVDGLNESQVQGIMEPLVLRLVDIRTCMNC